MGLFEDFGKKVKDAGQKSVQKTREISEISRINTLISQAESDMYRIYYSIGKTYVSLHRDDSEEALKSMVSSVINLESEKEEYKKQIQLIRGIRLCSHCGAELLNGSQFCSSCGVPVPKIQKPQYSDDDIRCDSCGAMVKMGMRFCTSCGSPLANKRQEPVLASDVFPEVESTTIMDDSSIDRNPELNVDNPEDSKPGVCPNCGNELAPDSIFCQECGLKL